MDLGDQVRSARSNEKRSGAATPIDSLIILTWSQPTNLIMFFLLLKRKCLFKLKPKVLITVNVIKLN